MPILGEQESKIIEFQQWFQMPQKNIILNLFSNIRLMN